MAHVFKIMAHRDGAPDFVTDSPVSSSRDSVLVAPEHRRGCSGASGPGFGRLRGAQDRESGFWSPRAQPEMRVPGAHLHVGRRNPSPRVLIPETRFQQLSETLRRRRPKPGLHPASGTSTGVPRPAVERAGSPRPAGSLRRRFGSRRIRGTRVAANSARNLVERLMSLTRTRVARTALRATSRSGESLTLLPYGESGDEDHDRRTVFTAHFWRTVATWGMSDFSRSWRTVAHRWRTVSGARSTYG